jgi:hypothetical protein
MKGVFATRVSGSADLYQVFLCYFFTRLLFSQLLTTLLAWLFLRLSATCFWDLDFAQCFSVLRAVLSKLFASCLYVYRVIIRLQQLTTPITYHARKIGSNLCLYGNYFALCPCLELSYSFHLDPVV